MKTVSMAIAIGLIIFILIALFSLILEPCEEFFGISTGYGCKVNEYGEPIDCCDGS